MSQKLANHLKSYGRDGDTELVHMTKGEIKGLQALAMAHGGSLTINPNTGLAEAGFLKNILPMVVGAALSPFITPMGAAAVVGGFEGIRTGDVGKGLLAGMGAFGGANLAGSLASAAPSATTSLAPATTNVAGEGARNIAADTIRTNVGAGVQGGMSTFPGAENAVLSNFQTTAPTTFANMGAGAENLYNTPGGMTDFLGSNKMNLAMSAAPAIGEAMTPKTEMPGLAMEDDGGPNKGKYLSANFQGYDPRRPNPYYRPTGLGYAAEGGVMPNDLRYAAGGMIDPMQQMPNGGLAALQGMRDGYGSSQTMDGNIPQMAGGGEIGGYSDGGRMLKGPGDGMSDSIPGVIGNKQPARLADGEFVVPADVVSHLGNGSTDAGAKKLYGMMDQVRKARTGTKKQGKQIKAEKYLPVKKMADGGVTAPAPSSSVVSPEALMGLSDLSALGKMISNSRTPARMAPATTPASAYAPAIDQIAATAAARPADEPVTFNAGKTRGLFGGDYSNIRPDMFIDPSAAGWEMYSSNLRSNPYGLLLGSDDDSAGGVFGRLNRSLSPAPEGSYKDPQGNVWVRKA